MQLYLITTDPVLFYENKYNAAFEDAYNHTEGSSTEYTLYNQIDASWAWDKCCGDGFIIGPMPITSWTMHFTGES